MLPDFDYGMDPTEIKQVVSYDEDTQAGGRRPAAGVAVAATRIATHGRATGTSRAATVNGPARPRPGVARPTESPRGSRPGGSRPAVPARARSDKPAGRSSKSRPAARPARKVPARRSPPRNSGGRRG
jgi:hypothetical protein